MIFSLSLLRPAVGNSIQVKYIPSCHDLVSWIFAVQIRHKFQSFKFSIAVITRKHVLSDFPVLELSELSTLHIIVPYCLGKTKIAIGEFFNICLLASAKKKKERKRNGR